MLGILDSEFIRSAECVLESNNSLVLVKLWSLVIMLIQWYPESASEKLQIFPSVVKFIDDFCILRFVRSLLVENEQLVVFHMWLRDINFVETILDEYARGNPGDIYEILLPCAHNRTFRDEFLKPSAIKRIMNDQNVLKFGIMTPLVTTENGHMFMPFMDDALGFIRSQKTVFGKVEVAALRFALTVAKLAHVDAALAASVFVEVLDRFPSHGVVPKLIVAFATSIANDENKMTEFFDVMVPVFIRHVRERDNVVLNAWCMNFFIDLDGIAKSNMALREYLESIPSYSSVISDEVDMARMLVLRPYGGSILHVSRPIIAKPILAAKITV